VRVEDSDRVKVDSLEMVASFWRSLIKEMIMLYDAFSTDYDRFVNWPGRLAVEMPFLGSRLRESGARRVLDAACGTGMHAIAMAKLGFEVAGADLSAGMIERARANAAASGLSVQFEEAGLGICSVPSAHRPLMPCSAWETPCLIY